MFSRSIFTLQDKRREYRHNFSFCFRLHFFVAEKTVSLSSEVVSVDFYLSVCYVSD